MNERQIFEGAIEFENPVDRRAFLDKACGGDVALRASVDALLAAHDAASQFLNTPAVEQLQGGNEKGLERTLDHSVAKPNVEMDFDDSTDGPDLSFLQPANKPGSIGSLGHYEILQILGQGAFGVVFRAFDEKLHRQVAVKAMNPQLAATSPPRKRFLREARSVAAIKHENIVQIYSVEEQPLPFLVMEFVQGQTLQQKLDGNGPLDVPEILHLGRQMAAGLAAAHALNMIHRDVKPGNILLEQGAEQKVKITDFGLARAADDASMTRTGVIAGTPMYMSPEQAEGRTLDARSDLFSLGSVLYQMATGRPPFRAPNTIAVLRRVVEDTPRPMSEIIADTPPWLETIVQKLLEKEPEKRFQSAKEVADLFARCQQELQLHGKVTCVTATAQPAALPSEPTVTIAADKSSAKQNRWLVAAPALIVVFLLGLYLINLAVDRFYPATPVNPPNANPTQVSNAPSIQKFASDEWIDVIPLIEPQKDKWNVAKQTGQNAWRIEQGELVVGGDALSSKLLLPLDSDWPAYECELEFTRRGGESGLNVNLPTDNGECPVVFDPPGSAGVHLGNRQQGAQLQADKKVVTDQRTTVRVVVHRATNNNDRVSVALNDATPWDWTGDLNALALPYRENFPQGRRISLFVHRGGAFVFHRIRVRMLDGAVASSLRLIPPHVAPAVAAKGWQGWPADAPKPAIAPFNAEQAKEHQQEWADYLKVPVEWENSIGMKFRLIPPGEFLMGSTAEEIAAALKEVSEDKRWQECIQSEAPQHKVRLTQPIYLGVNEVTQAEYEKVMGVNPSHFALTGMGKEAVARLETADHPVEMASWNDAAEFCAKLSEQEKLKPFYFRAGVTITPLNGTGYRLPSEAEWEFACRAGTATKYWIGDKDEDLVRAGWFNGNFGGRTHAAGELKANPFGLSDIHGNVWEWVQDGWDASYYGQFPEKPAINPSSPFSAGSQRVLRGGSWINTASGCRSSDRFAAGPTDRGSLIGFRVSLVVDAVRRMLTVAGHVISKPPAIAQPVTPNAPANFWHGWPVNAPKPAIAPFNAEQAKEHQQEWADYLKVPVEWENRIGMKFQLIPPGEFLMGSTAEEIAAALKTVDQNDKPLQEFIKSEAPQHKVILTQPLYLGTTEVTQAMFEKVMGANPSHFTLTGMGKEAVAGLETINHPVEMVSWNDAAEFCVKLSQQDKLKPWYFRAGETITPLDGTGYRLPSEAEWEFACRAGTVTRFWISDIDEDLLHAGWVGGNSGKRTHVAGELKTNPFGLADIHGNVLEWVQDGWDPTFYDQFQGKAAINPNSAYGADSKRVIRGGYWYSLASLCRSSYRLALSPSGHHYTFGFRVALPVDAVRQLQNLKAPATNAETLENYFARNRQAAERALALGGEVTVEVTKPFAWRTLKAGAPLPVEPFVLRMWSIKNSPTATNADLDVLAGLRHVLQLNVMTKSKLDAEIIPKIAALQSPVKELGIGHLQLKTSELDQLPVMPNVHVLWLSSEQVDDGWKFLRRFPGLRTLELYGAPLPDLGPLGDAPPLRYLRLTAWGELPSTEQIRDIQKRNPQLRIFFHTADELKVLGNDPAQTAARRLVEAGIPVEFFAADGARRDLTLAEVDQAVASNYVVVSIPRGVELTEELRNLLTHVNLHSFKAEGLRNADSLAQVLKNRQDIENLELTGSDLTDEGLVLLSRITGMRGLYLNGTQVTAAGTAAFHRAVPGCFIHSETGNIDADYAAVPLRERGNHPTGEPVRSGE